MRQRRAGNVRRHRMFARHTGSQIDFQPLKPASPSLNIGASMWRGRWFYR